MDRDQREHHQDVGSTWLVSCRNSPTPARDVAFVLHGGSRWARRSVASRAGRPPKVRPKVCESSGWQMVLWLGAPVGCFARRPATESATKSMRVIRLADGAVRWRLRERSVRPSEKTRGGAAACMLPAALRHFLWQRTMKATSPPMT